MSLPSPLLLSSKFIVIEGPDCSGTSRHSQFLAERLRAEGQDVLHTAEPTEGKIGREVRALLHEDPLPAPDAIQLMFCADRAEHVKTVIEPALKEGKVIICDRYALSTIIYGSIMGLDTEWLKRINQHFLVPDLTIITLPPFEVCVERMNRRKILDQFEQNGFPRKAYDAYAAVQDPATIFIDTSNGKEEVADDIFGKVKDYFGEVSREKIAEM